jgi:hypothetical protein
VASTVGTVRSVRPSVRSSRSRTPTGERWADRAHLLSLAFGFLLLLVLLRGTWFRGDDFEFLANRVGHDRSLSIWYPHNEHWSTGPIAIWRVLYDLFGVSSAMPYLACTLLAHAVAAHLLWRLMRHVGVDPWLRTGLAAVFLFLGAGWENITWAFQLGFVGAFTLGLGATLLCLHDGRRAEVGTIVLLVLGLTFTTVAVPFAISSALCLLLRGRVRRAIVLSAVTGSVFGVWYLTYGHQAPPAPHTQGHLDRLAKAAPWAWRLLTNSLELLTSLTGFGALLLAALTAYLVVRIRAARAAQRAGATADVFRTGPLLVIVVLLANLALQVATLAVGRNDISTPDASRYVYFVIALLLPVIGAALTDLADNVGRLLPLGVVAYLVATQGLVLLAAERPLEAPQMRADVMGLAALIEQRRPVGDTSLATDLDTQTIQKWLDEGAIGNLHDLPKQAVLDATALGMVSVVGTPKTVAAGNVLVGQQRLGGVPGACATATPPPGQRAALLELSPGQTVSVAVDVPANLTYRVLGRDGSASRLVGLPATPHAPLWLQVTEPLKIEVIADTGQDLTFCAPGPPTVEFMPPK